MGCFSSSTNSSIKLRDQLCSYSRVGKILIKARSKQKGSLRCNPIIFQLTEPVSISSQEIPLFGQKVLVSSCILPGIDPRGEYKKKCQDDCFVLHDQDGILCCLFDGHGRQGELVAAFCQSIIEDLFTTEKALLTVTFNQHDPQSFIKLATKTCDTKLSENTKGVDCRSSGW
jgi:hypothetical protein